MEEFLFNEELHRVIKELIKLIEYIGENNYISMIIFLCNTKLLMEEEIKKSEMPVNNTIPNNIVDYNNCFENPQDNQVNFYASTENIKGIIILKRFR